MKLLSILLLGLQVGSVELSANAHPSPRGCACHCATDQASFRVWQQKDGPPDRFIANIIGRWFDKIVVNSDAFHKTELLILLGRSAKGIWSVESQFREDGEGDVYTNLVVTTIDGKRNIFPLVRRFYSDSLYFPSVPDGSSKQEVTRRRIKLLRELDARILRRLRSLARSGQWDGTSITPVQLPLPMKSPALVFKNKANPCDQVEKPGSNKNDWYRILHQPQPNFWSLYVRGTDRRLRLIRRGGAGCESYSGAKCFGGIADDANGETWWILIKTTGSDSCGAEWHSIRLTNSAIVK